MANSDIVISVQTERAGAPSWSPNSTDLYFWYLFVHVNRQIFVHVNRQIQKSSCQQTNTKVISVQTERAGAQSFSWKKTMTLYLQLYTLCTIIHSVYNYTLCVHCTLYIVQLQTKWNYFFCWRLLHQKRKPAMQALHALFWPKNRLLGGVNSFRFLFTRNDPIMKAL